MRCRFSAHVESLGRCANRRISIVLNEESDPPEIYLDNISEVPAMAYDAQNRANAFFWENENNH